MLPAHYSRSKRHAPSDLNTHQTSLGWQTRELSRSTKCAVEPRTVVFEVELVSRGRAIAPDQKGSNWALGPKVSFGLVFLESRWNHLWPLYLRTCPGLLRPRRGTERTVTYRRARKTWKESYYYDIITHRRSPRPPPPPRRFSVSPLSNPNQKTRNSSRKSAK